MNVQRVAIEEKWARAKQLAVLDETAGAWTDENHPEMKTDEDIDRWLADLRAAGDEMRYAASGKIPLLQGAV